MVRHCLQMQGEVAEMTQLIAPGPCDIAILKPRHSAFYGTPLELLLDQMQVEQRILTDLATDICVLMTAMDAYLRNYRTWIPADCTAAENEGAHRWALHHMQGVFKCDVRESMVPGAGQAIA